MSDLTIASTAAASLVLAIVAGAALSAAGDVAAQALIALLRVAGVA